MHTCQLSPGRRLRRLSARLVVLTLGGVCLDGVVLGQEALINAVEGDRSLQRRIQQSNQPFDAPITLGPVGVSAGLGLDLTYTDNSENTGINPESDFIVTPGFDVGFLYQVTDTSRLAFGVGIGYQIFTQDTRPDRLLISPNSEIAYDFQAGLVLVTVYDTFSYQSDALDQGDIVNRSNYGGINNTVGVRALVATEPVYVEGGVSHFNFWSTESNAFNDLTRASEQLFFRVGHIIAEQTRWGVETSGSYTRYDLPIRSDLYQFSLGPYLEWQITQAWSLSGRFGWSWTEFEQNGIVPAPDDISSPYVGFDVTHQWTDNFRHTWSAVRDVSTGIETQIRETFVFRYGLNWQVTEILGFSAGAYYEIGEQPGLAVTEDYDYYGFSFGFPFAITDRFTTALGYEYRDRVSNIAGRSYSRNNVSLSLGYQF